MRRKILLIAGGIAALLVVGLAINAIDSVRSDSSLSTLGLNSDGGGDEAEVFKQTEEPRPAPSSDEYLADRFAYQGNDAAGGEAASGGAGGGPALPAPRIQERKIIRTATLELIVEDVGRAVQQVENAATAVGGFVSSSSLSLENPPPPRPGEEPPEPRQRATVTIRVPAEAYASVMSQLRGLAQEIRGEESQTSEVTEEYTDLQARLRNLEAAEQRYLELLARAESIPDILTVQDRLNQVRLEIEQVQGRIQLLDSLTSMATITVTLALPPLQAQETQVETEPSWAEKAWNDAWEASEEVLRALGTAAITAGVVAVWLLVPGLLILGGWWLLTGRRRHEAA